MVINHFRNDKLFIISVTEEDSFTCLMRRTRKASYTHHKGNNIGKSAIMLRAAISFLIVALSDINF